MEPLDRWCSLCWDEISLTKGLNYNKKEDKFIGTVDMGFMGREKLFADHALVFMVQGLKKKMETTHRIFFYSKYCFQRIFTKVCGGNY